ncbi:hypothetical protein DAPPUDRAFT_242656 [Daphnia pulex]|uniref:Uncharacterized protein n=1 Tax=Daphnia pulex TaxID=6669 RepID=E9GH63_DAPPU|nr:hypothetical protein DAPPUDRAFT_242656 [Daphnia pulex]|eukprot:EFX81148.1 hypothetical protein DAPPUDRAFT_242656 [Daphnia pulex]
MALPNHRIFFSASDWGRMEDVFTDDILFTNQPTPEPMVIEDRTDDEKILLNSPFRTASRTSTLDLQLISDDTLDELCIDADSHPELTHSSMNEVNWRNVVSVSQYIRDLQLQGGVDRRIYSPQLPAHPRYSRRQWNTPVPTADMVEVNSIRAPVRDKGEYFLMFTVFISDGSSPIHQPRVPRPAAPAGEAPLEQLAAPSPALRPVLTANQNRLRPSILDCPSLALEQLELLQRYVIEQEVLRVRYSKTCGISMLVMAKSTTEENQ